MDDGTGSVRRWTPYTTVRTLIDWAESRKGYLRGRALLSGIDMDDLTLSDFLNVTEAVLIEPAVHGGQSIDETLDKMEKSIKEAWAPILVAQGRGEEVFDTPEWRRRAQALEDMMPPVMRDPDTVIAEPEIDVDINPEDLALDQIDVPALDAFYSTDHNSAGMPHPEENTTTDS